MAESITVAGVDVGGKKKGFHVVALRDGMYYDKFSSAKAAEIALWCRSVGARIVGVDAPCRWSSTGRARLAERELMAKNIWCFSTPTRQVAEKHPKGNYDWMLAGEELYKNLERTHTLFTGDLARPTARVCFETFPQAIACALAGGLVSAKHKCTIRRKLLVDAGISIDALSNIDTVDAALCALAAQKFRTGSIVTFGDSKSGIIVIPRSRLVGKT